MNSSWYNIKPITEDIFAIDDNGQDWIFLIVGSEKALLIDTGWGLGDLNERVSSITNLPFEVVNTHGHPDHVGGDNQFSKIYISSEDKSSLLGCFSIEERRWALENVLKGALPEGFNQERWLYSRLQEIIEIPSGYCFNLGNKTVEAIKVQGHSPGSMAFLAKEDRLLFSGDSVLEGHVWMHLDHSSSLKTYRHSLMNLLSYSEQYDSIYPSHGGRVQAQVITDLVQGLDEVMLGERKGMPCRTFVGDGLKVDLGRTGFIYTEDKVEAIEHIAPE